MCVGIERLLNSMCCLLCQMILSALKDKVKQEKGKWTTRGKNSVSRWRINKLALTHSRYMSVSCMSLLTKQIHAERKWTAKERSAWTEDGERNGAATAWLSQWLRTRWRRMRRQARQGQHTLLRPQLNTRLSSALYVLSAEEVRNYC